MSITITLPADLERALRTRAAERGIDVPALVVESLRSTLGALESVRDAPVAAMSSAGEGDDESSPWRDVFVIELPHKELSCHEVIFPTAGLPRWQPEVILNPRWLADDDE